MRAQEEAVERREISKSTARRRAGTSTRLGRHPEAEPTPDRTGRPRQTSWGGGALVRDGASEQEQARFLSELAMGLAQSERPGALLHALEIARAIEPESEGDSALERLAIGIAARANSQERLQQALNACRLIRNPVVQERALIDLAQRLTKAGHFDVALSAVRRLQTSNASISPQVNSLVEACGQAPINLLIDALIDIAPLALLPHLNA